MNINMETLKKIMKKLNSEGADWKVENSINYRNKKRISLMTNATSVGILQLTITKNSYSYY